MTNKHSALRAAGAIKRLGLLAAVAALFAACVSSPAKAQSNPSTYAALSTDTAYILVLHNADPDHNGILDNRVTLWSTLAKISLDGVPVSATYDKANQSVSIMARGTFNRVASIIDVKVWMGADGKGYATFRASQALGAVRGRQLWATAQPIRMFLCNLYIP